MVRIGIVGIGFMGYTHFTAARRLSGGRVAAIATRSEKKLGGDWTGIQGNFGPRGGHVDLSDVRRYSDYRQLLADPEIDLVDICLPTDKHEQVVLEAVAAGKATLVEKPIAVDPAAADRMVAAAGEVGSLLMVAHVLPFFPEFQFVVDSVRSGRFGKLRAAHFRRVICPPDWSSEMADFRTLGGWGIDLHIHDNHFISSLCGVPRRVFSQGILQDGLVNHVHSQYVYDEGEPAVSCVSGGIAAAGYQFGHGFEVYLEEATILYDAGTIGNEWVVDRPLTLVTGDGRAEGPDLPSEPKPDPDGDWCAAFTSELQVAVDAVSGSGEPGALSGQLARDALKLCAAEAESIRTKTAVNLS